MKVFIIAATSIDGYIGRSAGHTADWTGKADKKVFVRLTKQSRVMVMGSNTFRTINRALPGRKTIVYTSKPESINIDGVETTQETPTALINRLENEGYTELAICGGTSIYTQFMQAGIVNEFYITVVPVIFGAGIRLFNTSLECTLQLLESENLEDGAVLLHYGVN